jgi:hypothetical protein
MVQRPRKYELPGLCCVPLCRASTNSGLGAYAAKVAIEITCAPVGQYVGDTYAVYEEPEPENVKMLGVPGQYAKYVFNWATMVPGTHDISAF